MFGGGWGGGGAKVGGAGGAMGWGPGLTALPSLTIATVFFQSGIACSSSVQTCGIAPEAKSFLQFGTFLLHCTTKPSASIRECRDSMRRVLSHERAETAYLDFSVCRCIVYAECLSHLNAFVPSVLVCCSPTTSCDEGF